MTNATQLKRPATTGCVCSRLRKASRRVSQIYDHYLEPHGLTITQFALLASISGHPGISIGALAERLIMDPTTLTRNLRPLERKSYLTLEPDPEDRRSRRLNLTETGRAKLKDARPAWAEAQISIETAVGIAETPALNAALDHLLDRLAS
jgi:DNA-binding MarR family transcriptional regulator